jgi:chromatin segregation and condensation protein Rec8/ScpA/Scc1 (kleisin family)
MAERDRAVDTSHLPPIPITVEQASRHLVDHLDGAGGRATFRALTRAYRTRVEVAVAFVAVLELYKNEHVEVEQSTHCGDMVIELKSDDLVAVTTGDTTVAYRPMAVRAGR